MLTKTQTAEILAKLDGITPVQVEALASIIRDMPKVSDQEDGFIDVRQDVADELGAWLGRVVPGFDLEAFVEASSSGPTSDALNLSCILSSPL